MGPLVKKKKDFLYFWCFPLSIYFFSGQVKKQRFPKNEWISKASIALLYFRFLLKNTKMLRKNVKKKRDRGLVEVLALGYMETKHHVIVRAGFYTRKTAEKSEKIQKCKKWLK